MQKHVPIFLIILVSIIERRIKSLVFGYLKLLLFDNNNCCNILNNQKGDYYEKVVDNNYSCGRVEFIG
jgi:hypothetical protein